MTDDLPTAAWTEALGPVLALMDTPRRGMFRQELQRFLATALFDAAAAEELAGPLRELLLQAARAAQRPAAISATRQLSADRETIGGLCEHILATWRDAEAEADADLHPASDAHRGDVFFGARLGGAGRPGAVPRDDE